MSYQITKENLIQIELLLNSILNETDRVTSVNIAHYQSSIKNSTKQIKRLLNPPKFNCYRCQDKGFIVTKEYKNKRGVVEVKIPCNCKKA